jgi:hypothetical protein
VKDEREQASLKFNDMQVACLNHVQLCNKETVNEKVRVLVSEGLKRYMEDFGVCKRLLNTLSVNDTYAYYYNRFMQVESENPNPKFRKEEIPVGSGYRSKGKTEYLILAENEEFDGLMTVWIKQEPQI